MNKTRIAVAGAGTIGRAHIDVLRHSPTCVLSATTAPTARGGVNPAAARGCAVAL